MNNASLEQRLNMQLAAIEAVQPDFVHVVQPDFVHVVQPVQCVHAVMRKLGNGHCIMCDGPMPIDIDHERAALEAEERAAQLELAELDADAARLDLAEFTRQGWSVLEPYELEWNWHHEALCRNVQGMLEEWLKRKEDRSYVMRFHKMCINICPSSLKSRIVMVFAPAWIWLRCPTFAWLCVSANPTNVTRDADACRDLITSKWYRDTFHITWTIREDINSKAKFMTTAGGIRINRGLVAKFTGIHVDGILVDDPDDAKDVWSDAARKERTGKIEAISSRLNDKRHYIFIVTQQRVHVADCTGELMARGGEILWASYPLLYSSKLRHDTPFFTDPRTEEGENMHPVRFTAAVIMEAKVELQSYGFQAQYNQNPADLSGGMFKAHQFRFFRPAGAPITVLGRREEWSPEPTVTLEVLPDGSYDLDALTLTIDATFGTTNVASDNVGMLLVGTKGPRHHIFADFTKQMTYPEMKTAIRVVMASHPHITRVLIEKAAAGNPLIQDLELELGGILGLNVKGDKKVRAAVMLPSVEAGNIFLLEGADWVSAFLIELCAFPNGVHDDRVDALSQLVQFFRESTSVQKQEALMAAVQVALAGMR
jgi:predicted phage terminase large subunit-like protein